MWTRNIFAKQGDSDTFSGPEWLGSITYYPVGKSLISLWLSFFTCKNITGLLCSLNVLPFVNHSEPCLAYTKHYRSANDGTVDPWTTWIWIVWVHLHAIFFPINILSPLRIQGFTLQIQPTAEQTQSFWSVAGEPLSVCIILCYFIKGAWASAHFGNHREPWS